MGKKTGRTGATARDLRSSGGGACLGDVAANAELRMRADTLLTTAWTVFLDRDLQSVTVVDDSGHPVGTLMRRDLADAVLDDGPTLPDAVLEELTSGGDRSAEDRPAAWRRGWRNEQATVEDIMHASVNTLPASASLEAAAAALEEAQLSEVVVVDERGSMLGLVAGEELVPYLPSGPGAGRARPRPGPSGRPSVRR
jgi:CBS-domain-containing membrane protein